MRHMSVHRRKPKLVDLLINKVPGAYSYRLKWGTNFDSAVWTSFIDASICGFRDPGVDDSQGVTLYGDRVRVLFSPASYSIPDDAVWWLKMSPLDNTGAEMWTTPALMILVPNLGGAYFPLLTITGTAPNALSVANSLEIDFPVQMRDLRIQSTAAVWAAFDQTGSEMLLQGDPLPKDISRWSTQSTLLIRGNGAAVPFSLIFTLAYTQ